ncbi:MAG: NAD(P)H-binding protein [Deltaproteobacteria bacterium]|nr:NAD(P)H-binding protein [Kofleriaceae bacterium]
MRALVLGATGFVGRALVDALVEAGDDVRAASRRPPGTLPERARWVPCDLLRPETVAPALEGIEVAYYLVHSMGLGRRDFAAIDRACAHELARAAAASSCRRIIYLGGVAPRGRPSPHLASRLEVGEILRDGTVPALELRASMIVGNGSASWQIVRDLTARLPFMVLPRWLESKSCPIALADVVAALLEARRVPLAGSTWFDIPGPEVLSMRQMLETVAALEGRRIPSFRVPVLTPRLSAMWLRLISGADYTLARELVLGLTEDLLPQRSFWEVTGHPARHGFREAAAAALASEPSPSPLARVVEATVRRVGPSITPREPRRS